MQSSQLFGSHYILDSSFQKGDPPQQIENVKLLNHLFSALEVQFRCWKRARTAKEFDDHVCKVKQKVKELVLFELFAHLLVIRFEQIASDENLKGIAVVNIDQEETYSYCAEKSSDVGQNLIYFLKTSLDCD